ncbi:MAG: hypothetical protein CBB72_010595 [Muricauda sp. TMED12]|jgi:hypothetical protein|nr:MAG: hypothetical protein CBB72_010595 [Muricauda sp. TMED12]|tara:strand:- start:17828 stop:18883 length:1056 start_codon:yes stop_codon:yes gene_type:complete
MKNLMKTRRYSLWLFAVIGVFVFNSCTEDVTMDENMNAIQESEQQRLSLVSRTGDPIIINDLSENDISAARATGAAGNDRGRFNITLKFLLPPTERQQEVFDGAAARWERIIIKDVPSFTGTIPSSFTGFPPAVDGTLDDVVIEVALAPIDGPGGILGQAGPSFVRTEDFLTLSGVMFFDVADLDFLESLDLFEDVIVHEMGHVLGIGTLWNTVPFGFDRTLLQGPLTSPYFAGAKANVFWNAEGGTGELPIENDFGPGTAFGHWKETTLNNELMTGFLNLGENPLSRITAGSMADLGYGAASVGESYDLPKGTPGVNLSTLDEAGSTEGLNIGAMETLLMPIGFVSTSKK